MISSNLFISKASVLSWGFIPIHRMMPAQIERDGHSVAVTGLSCRFPGDGDNLGNFWESICHGKCKCKVVNS